MKMLTTQYDNAISNSLVRQFNDLISDRAKREAHTKRQLSELRMAVGKVADACEAICRDFGAPELERELQRRYFIEIIDCVDHDAETAARTRQEYVAGTMFGRMISNMHAHDHKFVV